MTNKYLLFVFVVLFLSAQVNAATVNRFVNTASTAGGDGTTNNTTGSTRAYASLSEWESNESTDLVADGDVHIVTCGGGVDTTDTTINGWTTGSSNGITIQCTTDKHDGRSRDVSGSGYQISSGSATGTLKLSEDYVTIDGLDIKNTTTNPAITWTYGTFTAADNSQILKNTVCQNVNTSSSSYIINCSRLNVIITFENVIAYGGTRGMDSRSASTVTINHCTFWRHQDQLGLVADTEATVKNTYIGKASGSSQDFWTGGAAPSGNNNASSDTSVSTDYSSSQASQVGSTQFVSVTAGSEDFTLKASSGLEANGASGISTNDIIGTTRDVSTPDIGAFEFIATSTRRIMVVSQYINNLIETYKYN